MALWLYEHALKLYHSLYLCWLQLDFICAKATRAAPCLQSPMKYLTISWILASRGHSRLRLCSNRRRVAINIGLKRAVFFAVVQSQSIPAGGICRIDTLQLVAEIKLVNMVILSHAGSICRVVSCPQEPNKRNDFLKVWSTQLNSLQRQAEHGDSGKRGSVCWLIISFLPSIDSSLWLSVVNLNWSAASFLTFISQTDERFSRKSPNYLACKSATNP